MGSQTLYDRWVRATEVMSTYRVGRVPSMLHTAANVAERLGISRDAQDEFALRSQTLASAAIEAGKFKDEIVPVPVPQKCIGGGQGIAAIVERK